MEISAVKGKVRVAFPLTQVRGSCRILMADYTHVARPREHTISLGDRLEWMVRNQDLQAILTELEHILGLNAIKGMVQRLRAGHSIVQSTIDVQKRPVRGDFREEAPGLFVKFPLGKASQSMYVADELGNIIRNPIRQKIPPKSSLVWFPMLDDLEVILRELMALTPRHGQKVEDGVFRYFA